MLRGTLVRKLRKQNPHKIGTTSGKTRLSNLSIVPCQAERTFKCGHQKSVLSPELFNILICYFDNGRTSMLWDLHIIRSQKGLSAFWRTELKLIMTFVDWRNYVKFNDIKLSKDKWLGKEKSNIQVQKYPVLAPCFESDRQMWERSEL